jgi:hypothetical protein
VEKLQYNEEDDLWEGGKNARCLAALQCAGEGAGNKFFLD